jgi:polyhydroxybutyrate depolymerase
MAAQSAMPWSASCSVHRSHASLIVAMQARRWLGWVLVGALGCGGPGTAMGEGDGTETGSSTTGGTGEPATDDAPAPGTSTSGVDSSGTSDSTTQSVDDTTAGVVPACQLDTPFPDPMSAHVLVHDDLDRSYVVYVPPGYDHETPTPLVLSFHGYSNSPQQQEEWSGLSEKAAQEGFVLVYPSGTGGISGWNGGDCCGSMVDDVGFVGALLDTLESELCIDPSRIYATGFSNGGFLSHRLACELPDRIAAIASVAGVMGVGDCAPARPMPVLQMHGTGDFVVPYNGSAVLGFESVAETMAGWVERDGCVGDPVVSYVQDEVTCERHEACGGGVEVELCTIEGGGHTWPGGADIFGAGPTTQNLSANDRLWEFFVAHPLP